jgi:2-C-methyl-D-erythritol 4-phosphate cytidylyltransferase
MNTAIIVAAGTGSRFKSDIPKQFVEILGKPVIIHTLKRFDVCEMIDEIVLVLSPEGKENFKAISGGYEFSKPVVVVPGGTTRAESVRNGLDAVGPDTEIVAIHDGARPLVSEPEICSVIEKAAEIGAACLTVPVTDTIKQIDGGSITGTLDRTKLRRALTPQAFRFSVLREAFAGADLNESATDECYLVERTGREIAYVDGSPRNIKITTPDDIVIARMYLEQELSPKCTA